MTTNQERDRLLEHYLKVIDFTDAGAVMAARVHLGTADFTERLRYWLRIGPSSRALKAAELNKQMRKQIESMR